MRKKIAKTVVLIGTPIFSFSTLLSVGLIFNVNNEENDASKLKNFFANPNKLQNYLTNKYEMLIPKAKTNEQYLDWIKGLDDSYLIDIEKGVEEIASLSMDFDLKSLLLKNYLDKAYIGRDKIIYEDNANSQSEVQVKNYYSEMASKIYQSANIEPKKDKMVETSNKSELENKQNNPLLKSNEYVNENYLFLNMDGIKEQIRDPYGYRIPISGYDAKYTDYHAFADDNTDFYMSNQNVLEMSYKKVMEKNYQDQKAQMDNLQNLLSTSQWSNLMYVISKDIKQISRFKGYEFTKYMSTMYNIYKKFNKNFKLFKIGKHSFNVKTTQIFSLVYNLADQFIEYGFPNNWDDFVTITMNVIVKSGILSSVAGFAVPGLGTAVAVITFLLKIIPSGNGHSLMDNFDDHGLNDWDYQWKQNSDNMVINAVNWSQDYRKGVKWRVSDGWFYTPRLSIATYGSNSYTSLSGTNVSSNDFNWGHKIPVRYP